MDFLCFIIVGTGGDACPYKYIIPYVVGATIGRPRGA